MTQTQTTQTTKTKYEDLAVPELINLLTVVLSEKDRVYRFHPSNPKYVSIEEEYDSLISDVGIITDLISKKSK